MALHTGEFLRTRANPMLDMLLQSQVAQRMRTNPMAAYNMRGLSFYRVSGLTDTVLAVERGCAVAGRDAADACGALKAALVEHLLFADDEPKNWAELLKLAQDGAFKRKGERRVRHHLAQCRDGSRAGPLQRLSGHHAGHEPRGRGGAGKPDRRRGAARLGPHAMLPSIIAKNEEDLLSAWSHQSRIVAQGEPLPFRVDGLVSGVRRDASGLLELSVDSERSLDEPWSSLAYTAWLLLAALLVLVHLPLAVIRLRQAGAPAGLGRILGAPQRAGVLLRWRGADLQRASVRPPRASGGGKLAQRLRQPFEQLGIRVAGAHRHFHRRASCSAAHLMASGCDQDALGMPVPEWGLRVVMVVRQRQRGLGRDAGAAQRREEALRIADAGRGGHARPAGERRQRTGRAALDLARVAGFQPHPGARAPPERLPAGRARRHWSPPRPLRAAGWPVRAAGRPAGGHCRSRARPAPRFPSRASARCCRPSSETITSTSGCAQQRLGSQRALGMHRDRRRARSTGSSPNADAASAAPCPTRGSGPIFAP